MKVKVKGQGHNVKKAYFQGFNMLFLTCDLVVKGHGGQGHKVKVKCHTGQGQIGSATNNLLLCFLQMPCF